MATSVDKVWINKAIGEYNRGNEKTLEQLADEIIRHGRFDAAKKGFLVRHLEASSDGGGIIQTNATEIFDLFASQPAGATPERKTLKLSGNMMTMDIDRGSGRVLHPDDVVEKLLGEDEIPPPPGGIDHEEMAKERVRANSFDKRCAELVQKLKGLGIDCEYEYPGYLACPCKLGSLNVGTVDGYWGADIDDDGYNITISPEAFVPFEQMMDVAPEAITDDNLINAIKTVLDWANA